jgi:hypothetical protein
MPKHRKLTKNEKKMAENTGANIVYAIEKSVDFIFKCLDGKEKPQTTPEPEPSPTPSAAVIHTPPPPPTFMQDIETSHERRLEQKKIAKQFLRRLK